MIQTLLLSDLTEWDSGDVKGKNCVLVDDIIDMSALLSRAVRLLLSHGAQRVWIAGVHGVFATHEDVEELLLHTGVQSVIVTDTIDCTWITEEFGSDRLIVLDTSELFSEAIRRIHFNENLE